MKESKSFPSGHSDKYKNSRANPLVFTTLAKRIRNWETLIQNAQTDAKNLKTISPEIYNEWKKSHKDLANFL